MSNEFGFSFMPSIPQFKWWIKDYIFCSRATSPIENFKYEEGLGISRLYEGAGEFDGVFVYPKPKEETGIVDFAEVYGADANGDICYALTYAVSDCTLKIDGTDMVVFVNGKKADFRRGLQLHANDEVLVKSCKSSSWRFWFDKYTDIGLPFIQSNRKSGDKWLIMGSFGSKDAFESGLWSGKRDQFNQAIY